MRRVIVLLSILLATAPGLACTTRAALGTESTPTTGVDLDAQGVLAASSSSVALIETPLASGSGVLIDDGYVVTNAHVVDPFGTADLSFEGGRTFTDVPVVGSDLETDIALLGPVDIDAPPLQLSPDPSPAKGSNVFLVGYPGGGEADDSGRTKVDAVEVTISGGIVSRQRTDEVFNHTYIQTDASIGPGQSGGALIDGTGRVVGISGLSFEDTFALALSSRDTTFAVNRIRRGDATGYPVFPTEFDTTAGTLDFDLTSGFLDPANAAGSLVFATNRPETVRLTIDDPNVLVSISSLDGSLYRANEAQRRADDVSFGTTQEPRPEEMLETVDGAYQFDVGADSQVVIDIQPAEFGSSTVGFAIDRPVRIVRDDDLLRIIGVGETLTGVVGPLEFEDDFTIYLSAGQRITVTADGAAGGDVFFTIVGPSDDFSAVEPVDNDTRGLLNLGESEEYMAAEAGVYAILVSTNDVTATYFRLEVRG